ncbi:hypothetical protein [Streptomyces sp. NPDC001809]
MSEDVRAAVLGDEPETRHALFDDHPDEAAASTERIEKATLCGGVCEFPACG